MKMVDQNLVERLAQHRTIGSAPRAELEWLATHGYMQHFERGELIRKGDPVRSLWVFLSGQSAFYLDRGLGPRKVTEWRAGDVSGVLPYSRVTTSPGEGVILEPVDALLVDKAHLPALIRECPTLTELLVHNMLDRARTFTSSDLHYAKMASLGTISAGVAHQLNNPAAAVARSAKLLNQALSEAEAASRTIGAAHLTDAQLAVIEQLRLGCAAAMPVALTPIQRADCEEALTEWLEGHGVNSAAASALVDTGTTPAVLDGLATTLQGRDLDAAVRWIAAGCTIRMLTSDIERAASRISHLAGAIKRFTYMDRQETPEAIALAQGLYDSVALLLHKARNKSIGLNVHIADDVPKVRAIGSDLNQVWTNLIDNAIDAVPESGHVQIEAVRQANFVVVQVIDDGPGIPPEIRERIFDPFFTTKPVGQGTGLGLPIARELIQRNEGDIDVVSQPGRTEFRVSLPIASEATA